MKKQGKSNGGLSDRMPLTAYASLKTVHWTVFRAFGAPNPLREKTHGERSQISVLR